jgi:hypothetical protein
MCPQYRSLIHAALNLLPVLPMRTGLAKLPFKAQHCRMAATPRARNKFFQHHPLLNRVNKIWPTGRT